jgi:hypothetical protein
MIANGEVPLDDLTDDIEGMRALVQAGDARLEVKTRPWGLEFSLVAVVPRSSRTTPFGGHRT